jgi:hypothetical protein
MSGISWKVVRVLAAALPSPTLAPEASIVSTCSPVLVAFLHGNQRVLSPLRSTREEPVPVHPAVDPAQLWVLVGSGAEYVCEHHGLADVGVLGRGE